MEIALKMLVGPLFDAAAPVLGRVFPAALLARVRADLVAAAGGEVVRVPTEDRDAFKAAIEAAVKALADPLVANRPFAALALNAVIDAAVSGGIDTLWQLAQQHGPITALATGLSSAPPAPVADHVGLTPAA